MTDPRGPEAPVAQSVDALFDTARGDVATDADVARVAQRLGHLLGEGAGAGSGAAAAGRAVWVKGVVITGVAVGIGLGAWWGAGRLSLRPTSVPAFASAVAPRPSATETDSRRSSEDEAVPVERLPLEAPGSRVGRATASAAPSELDAGATSVAAEPAPENVTGAGSSVSEFQLLNQARLALRTDPSRALALTQEHRRLFPSSSLAQEREVVAVEALTRLGRAGEAKEAARDFRRRYPDSAHVRRLDELERNAR